MEPTDPPMVEPRDAWAETRRAIRAIALGALLGSVLARLAGGRPEAEGR
jgi:hypothetical protein